jgi:hypothetical protein
LLPQVFVPLSVQIGEGKQDKMLNLPWQDELLEHSEAAEDMMAKKLDLLEEWLEDTNSKKLVMSNKLITRSSMALYKTVRAL